MATKHDREQTLIAWLDEAKSDMVPGIDNLNRPKLMAIARTTAVDETSIAAMLNADQKPFAKVIAGVLSGLEDSAEPAVAPPRVAEAPRVEPTLADRSTPLAVPAPAAPAAGLSFAPYRAVPPPAVLAPVEVIRQEDGSLVYRWAPVAAPVVYYRVAASEATVPTSPEDITSQVAVVSEPKAQDSRSFTRGIRYIRVWANAGATELEALAAQPQLIAGDWTVAAPLDVVVKAVGPEIVGSWRVLDGTLGVDIREVPVTPGEKPRASLLHRILTETANLNGFRSSKVTPGVTYFYELRAEAEVGGVRKSSVPVQLTAEVAPTLTPVTDLLIETAAVDSGGVFDLVWTRPTHGRVAIYLSDTEPHGDAGDEAGLANQLGQRGVSGEAQINPVQDLPDGRSRMSGVRWPAGQSKLVLTPVTLFGDQAFVGPSVVRVAQQMVIPDATVVERVDAQFLAIQWPEDADRIVVFQSPKGQPPELAVEGQPYFQVDRAAEPETVQTSPRLPGRLPAGGCDLHLLPVRFYGGMLRGTIKTITYPGLMEVRYQLSMQRKGISLKGIGEVKGVTVSIEAAGDYDQPPAFVLVYNRGRLPLSRKDGQVLKVLPKGVEGQPAELRLFARPLRRSGNPEWVVAPESWHAISDQGSEGFIRLFVDLPPQASELVALRDPEPGQLQLRSLVGLRG